MNTTNIRNMMEYQMLPQWFYHDQAKFLGYLIQDKELIFRILDDLYSKDGILCPYTKEQFDVDASRVLDDIMMVKVIMPEPETAGLCYSCYMFFDRDFKNAMYYMVEKSPEQGMDLAEIRSLSPEGEVTDHGHCALENQADFFRCSELFLMLRNEREGR